MSLKSSNSNKAVQVEGKAATANHVNIPSERLLNLQKLVQRATIYSKFLSAKLVDTESGTNEEMLEKSQPGLLSGATLRDYQIVGFKWLVSLYENGLNGILADEMGLGKTLQTIALLAHLREMGTNGPFLIVAPLSTVSNWIAEFAKFTPTLPTVTYHGDPKVRTSIRAMHMRAKSDSPEFPVVVTSYEICIRDKKYLSKIPWKYIVVDEGHRLKNLDCKLVKELKSYKSANRLLLTGTPLQNNLSELWSLLNFLMPEIFNDLGAFEEWFEWANDVENIEAGSTNLISSLHDILTPFLLRRIKEEVTLDLPKKREYVLYAPMLAKQRELYSAVLRRELATVLENNMSSAFSFDHPSSSSTTTTIPKQRRKRVRYTERESSDFSEEESLVTLTHDEASKKSKNSFIKNLVGRQNLQMMIMQLRKSCNHPYLFHIESESTSNPLVHGVPETLAWSGKMLLLDRLLSALLPKGHKVLIFSQFTSMLNIIQDYLWFVKGLKACRIDGNVKLDERKLEIADFSKSDSNLSVFLLSTRAGGLGINLTAADTVIIFDSDWNPQCDLQAQDRVHRIGQKRPVIVYRLITSNSIEKKILDKARAKRTLERLVIHKAKFKGNQAVSAAEEEEEIDIQAILQQEKDSVKSGGVLDGDAEADLLKYLSDPSSIISDQELEEIMDRSDAAYQRFQQRNETSI